MPNFTTKLLIIGMSYLKISPDLFLEAAELNKQKQFLDDSGFRKNILDNSVSFGLIKTSKDYLFANGRVEKDTDTDLSQRAIKVRELNAVDKYGNFIHLNATSGIAVPSDGNWYWVKVAYATTNIEEGAFSLSANGDLVDTSGKAKLTQLFRGMPNFPTRVKFVSSVFNTLEYDVLEVIDDSHATLQHPASSANGISTFQAEDNLSLAIVGTFTQGIAVPNANKYPFNYDSATITLVQEVFVNTRPLPYVQGADFYIARVQATQNTVIIQDKRVEYWETKGSNINLEIDRNDNPLIGIESVQFNNPFSPADKNIVKLSWGMRSDNWSIDSSNNIVTFNSGLGGKYKTVNDFNNGDLDGGRLYTMSGKYAKIASSVKQGSAINFILDVLDVDNFSTDGGATLLSGTLMACPDCEEVEILFTPNAADNTPAIQETFTFPVSETVGRCDVLVYKDPSVLYNVSYRYKNIKETTGYKPIPSDTTNGYFTEISFDDNGNLKSSDQRVYYPYTSAIQLNLSPLSISKFRNKVDKGDLIGVNSITDFTSLSTINLIVGQAKNYQYVSGNITLANDIYFALSSAATEGNEFRIHFNCTSLNLNGNSIFIVSDMGTPSQASLKHLVQGDIYQMLNQENGIVITLKYTGGKWVASQNYDLGRPNEIINIDGTPTDLFDASTGLGKIRGLFGYVICDTARTVNGVAVPNLRHRFLLGQDDTQTKYNAGASGGEETHTLTLPEIPSNEVIQQATARGANGDPSGQAWKTPNGDVFGAPFTVNFTGGGDQPHNNMPPYYAVILVKKVF